MDPSRNDPYNRKMLRRLLWLACSVSLIGICAPGARALSIGQVERGSLRNGIPLSVSGPHHYILPRRHRARGLRFGTSALVEAILEAAQSVHLQHGGARLAVGNLSRRNGGWIRFSRSHQSGRDADLGFFLRRRGRPFEARDLHRMHPRNRGPIRFDVARNWSLVEALLISNRVAVQWLLVSRGLRRRLLRYARHVGADPELIRRARRVLHQPTWSSPHDDHFHLRIYCPAQEVARGCQDTGPKWPWVSR